MTSLTVCDKIDFMKSSILTQLYYLIDYDAAEDKLKHYRVDKMRNIELLDSRREGRDCFQQCDMASYARKNFGMFGGEAVKAKLEFQNDIVGVLLDLFSGNKSENYRTGHGENHNGSGRHQEIR